MNVWALAACGAMIAGLAPALVLACRGGPVQRLVGLQLASAAAVMALIALSESSGQASYLIVPLVLALLSVTGTLTFTHLLRPGPRAHKTEESADE